MKPIVLVVITLIVFALNTDASHAQDREMPITTSSSEARALYRQAEDLTHRQRGKEAISLYQRALALDSNFAMAYMNLAFLQTTNMDLRRYISKAVALSASVSESERLVIQAAKAGIENNVAKVKELWEKLLKLFPNDKRLRATSGDNFLFTYNEPDRAIAEYKKAIEIDPLYYPVYNSLGYAYSALGNYSDAEKALKKYTELLPDESNPHDSYAEVLMKQGKFDESIAEYKKSLSINPQFISSYAGLGMSYVLMGNADEGRKQFRTMFDMAEDDNDRLQALIASTRSYLIERMYDRAIIERNKMYALFEKTSDFVRMVYNMMGTADVFVEAGKPKEAKNTLRQVLRMIHDTRFPADVKGEVFQALAYEEAVVALAFNDFGTAKSKVAEFKKSADKAENTTQIQSSHQLAGRIALKEKRFGDALQELQQADQRSARTLYEIARVHAAKGESEKARGFFGRAANFNDMSYEYAIVRLKAKRELEKVKL